jgi:hypothetical protein
MKSTLLEITQEVLSAMSSDEVNSVSDSAESLQVANIIKRKYYDIVSRGDLPEHNQLFQLNPSLSNIEPTLMFIPDGIGRIEWIKYFNTNPNAGGSVLSNTRTNEINQIPPSIPPSTAVQAGPGYQYVTMLPIAQFLEITNFDPADPNVNSYIFSDTSNDFPDNFTIFYKNDNQPRYCCILSNFYVIFDSYDSTQDTTLQGSKTECFGQVVPAFKLEDSFIPDLDVQQFPLLINEAKALAFYELKQQPHAKAELEIKRQWSAVQKHRSINNRPSYFGELPDFGRKAVYTRTPHIRWH